MKTRSILLVAVSILFLSCDKNNRFDIGEGFDICLTVSPYIDNEIVITFVSNEYADPRMDSRIVERLKADGKIE
jgi:hypothetical protein